MIKNESKIGLASGVLAKVYKRFYTTNIDISICELSRCTGIERRTLDRYLAPKAKSDLPIAALCLICNALHLPLDDVIPVSVLLTGDNTHVFVPTQIDQYSGLKELNDIYVDRLRAIIKDRYPRGGYYQICKLADAEWYTEAGLRNAFRRKADGHYPLMSLSLSVAIAAALQIQPSSIFN